MKKTILITSVGVVIAVASSYVLTMNKISGLEGDNKQLRTKVLKLEQTLRNSPKTTKQALVQNSRTTPKSAQMSTKHSEPNHQQMVAKYKKQMEPVRKPQAVQAEGKKLEVENVKRTEGGVVL